MRTLIMISVTAPSSLQFYTYGAPKSHSPSSVHLQTHHRVGGEDRGHGRDGLLGEAGRSVSLV